MKINNRHPLFDDAPPQNIPIASMLVEASPETILKISGVIPLVSGNENIDHIPMRRTSARK
jgi:hypothetical protein